MSEAIHSGSKMIVNLCSYGKMVLILHENIVVRTESLSVIITMMKTIIALSHVRKTTSFLTHISFYNNTSVLISI